MYTKNDYWEMKIIGALLPVEDLCSLAAGDIYSDGRRFLVTGGNGGLFWYFPSSSEKGLIDSGSFGVGLILEDVDGDGVLEIVTGKQDEYTGAFSIILYKSIGNTGDTWKSYIIDSSLGGSLHDLIFCDIDGDGNREMLANAVCTKTPGVFLYKPLEGPYSNWKKYAVTEGFHAEGLAVSDLNGDRRLEIISGPYWYICPEGGPFSGYWRKETYAPSFRDMCRVTAFDITGTGREDIIAVESEYREGQLSWFENRIVEDPENPWVEHPIDDGFVFSHSIQAWKDKITGKCQIFLAEMSMGGWFQPYNWDARLLKYSTTDNGTKWSQEIIYKGAGTHQAFLYDIDNDGEEEIIGKTWKMPIVQIWKQRKEPSPLTGFKHMLIDRDKPFTSIDIFAVDLNGDGLEDIVCGKWWYRNPGWERFEIPGIYQVVGFHDIDGDGCVELICTRKAQTQSEDFYSGLSSDFCWLKPLKPEIGKWEEYDIGKGSGVWPHGVAIVPVTAGMRAAMAVAYHGAGDWSFLPEIFEIPEDPKKTWTSKILAEIEYEEELKVFDMNNDGRLDLLTGNCWLENMGNGEFTPRKFAEDFKGARVDAVDINGDGFIDVVIGEEVYKEVNNEMAFSRLVWFENPGVDSGGCWEMHVIDILRCPHSLCAFDIDGDGETEIICAEHDPFKPNRSRSRLFIYKKADSKGLSWYRYLLDDRFEHHTGTKIIELKPGKYGIVSHGWSDWQFVHLWWNTDAG